MGEEDKGVERDNEKGKSKIVVDRFNGIQMEILNIGWNGILRKYHPDENMEDPHAFKIFQLYKEVFESMRKRLILTPEMNIDD